MPIVRCEYPLMLSTYPLKGMSLLESLFSETAIFPGFRRDQRGDAFSPRHERGAGRHHMDITGTQLGLC